MLKPIVIGWTALLILAGGCATGGGTTSAGNATTLSQPKAQSSPAGQEEAAIRGHMRGIADAIGALNDEVYRDGQPDLAVASAKLEVIQKSLQALSTLETNRHPFLSQDLRGFVQEVERAKQATQAEPPDLRYAAGIVGACVYCHNLRPCGSRPGLCPDVEGL